jgi:hypothetical protein
MDKEMPYARRTSTGPPTAEQRVGRDILAGNSRSVANPARRYRVLKDSVPCQLVSYVREYPKY